MNQNNICKSLSHLESPRQAIENRPKCLFITLEKNVTTSWSIGWRPKGQFVLVRTF